MGVEGAFGQAGRVQQQQQHQQCQEHSRVANRAELRAEQVGKQGRTGLPVVFVVPFLRAFALGWERHGR